MSRSKATPLLKQTPEEEQQHHDLMLQRAGFTGREERERGWRMTSDRFIDPALQAEYEAAYKAVPGVTV